MKNITKKPAGKIEVIERHRTYKGVVYRPGEQYEYYTIINKSEACGCSQVVTFTKFYELKTGLIPTNKAKLI